MEDSIITLAALDAGRDLPGGAWNAAQLAILGVPWPPPSGWRQRIIGKRITAAAYARFLALKGNAGKARPRTGTADTPSLFD